MISVSLFLIFVFKYYFIQQKFADKILINSNYLENLEKKISNLPYLESNTENIIDFNNTVNNLDNKRKKRKFWDLIKK